MVQYNLEFLGTTVVDKRFSNPMVPWVIADVKRRKKTQKVTLIIDKGEIIGKTEDVIIFRHQVQNLNRFCLEPNNMRTFMYLLKDEFEPVFNVYLFQTAEFEDVVEIFQTMKDSIRDQPNMTKSHSSAATLISLCSDISPTSSQFFEVLYVGKMKVSHRRVPDTFIDEALERIRLYEIEKSKKMLEQKNEKEEKQKQKALGSNVEVNNGHCDNAKVHEHGEVAPTVNNNNGSNIHQSDSDESKTGGSDNEVKNSEETNQNRQNSDVTQKKVLNENGAAHTNLETDKKEQPQEGRVTRPRAGSLGVIETFKKKVDDSNQNRTMLFYVGRSDLRLISPDRKQVLLHKSLKDINSCLQGIENNQHFGIISREADSYVGYVFKCESDSVADHIVSAISKSFQSVKETKERPKQPVLSCEHCPMVWFHKLCAEVEGLNEKKTQLTILKKIETLPEHEQMDIHTKFLGTESSDIKEQNEFLMILLRTHCERKQIRHVHDSAETRSEFLNQVLGGNTIFMKAKRSLTSSFDQLLKRKGSQTDIFHSKESVSRKSDSTINECGNEEYQRSYLTVGSADGEIMRKEISKQISQNRIENDNFKNKFEKDKSSDSEKASEDKGPGFSDIAAITVNNQKIEKTILSSSDAVDSEESESSKTPMINMFLKVGSSSKSPTQSSSNSEEFNQTQTSGSWRQAIFNRVVTPGKSDESNERYQRRRTKQELRELWKTAINQQILLIRMEKENARLKARQEEATVKRIKLEFDELGSASKEYMGIWDLISVKDNRISSKCDSQILLQAVRQGIPRARRGDVWYFLAVQFCLKQPPFDSTGFPNYDVPYEDLLKQLTSFQHAILIDLGRAFPNHPYFSSPLGPGQLALFNLLKGYSLLDPQVGYCQGLNFVAGVLLLHLSEDTAFLLLRHLMFRRGLRKQYLPDMAALQVQLYQLSRLIHDTLPKLYAHFDKNEISPTLFATSWMLTLFASQFPLGFVARVYDLLFVEQTTEVIFRIIMALLELHKEAMLQKTTFEEIMDYLKHDISKMDSQCVDQIIKKVVAMDITKQLHEYEVEYHVLQEEMSTPRPELDQLKKIKAENSKLLHQQSVLIGQLEMVNKNITRLEKFRSSQQSTINKLETQVRNLEMTVRILGDFISEISEEHKDIKVPGDIRRIISNLEVMKQSNGKHVKNETNSKKAFDKSALFKRIHSSIDFYERPHFSELCTPDYLPSGTKYGDQGADEKGDDSGKSNHKPNIIRGVPLKVIVDNDDEDRKRVQQHSPNLTSKITSGVSSFFNSSHSQGNKNHKNNRTSHDQALHSSHTGETENLKSKHNFSSEIGSLNIKESALKKLSKNNELVELNSKDSSPVRDSLSNTAKHFHPLDNSEVNITFNGTTKLKSIKPSHKLIRNNTIDVIPIKNDILHISEGGSPPKENSNCNSKSIEYKFNESF